jgi:hypothetical protein
MNAAEFPPALRGPWGKLRDYAARLTLILACLDHAADFTADPCAVPEAHSRAVGNAWTLIAYFKSHARRVHAAVTGGVGTANVNAHTVGAIVEWVRAGSRNTFTEAELKDARRWIRDADLADALKFLTDRGAIRPRPVAEPGPKGGRRPSRSYAVNPAIHRSR